MGRDQDARVSEEAFPDQGVARIRVRSESDGAYGLAYGFQDPSAYYRFSVNRQSGLARLVRAEGGQFAGLASTDLAPLESIWQEIEIRREGDPHVASVDGEVVVEDSVLPGGLVVSYAWEMEGLFFGDLAVYPQRRRSSRRLSLGLDGDLW
ncbi:MAG: hypothetical protein ACQEXJ_14095 [Myxococcota bacterium]